MRRYLDLILAKRDLAAALRSDEATYESFRQRLSIN
jgi:hypothetical protein